MADIEINDSGSLCLRARRMISDGVSPDETAVWTRDGVPVFDQAKTLGWWAEREAGEGDRAVRIKRYRNRPPKLCTAALADRVGSGALEQKVPPVRAKTTGGETSDGYAHVVARIDGTMRIIRCSANIQFIAQERQRNGQWRSFSYFATSKGAARLPAPFRGAALALFETPASDRVAAQ